MKVQDIKVAHRTSVYNVSYALYKSKSLLPPEKLADVNAKEYTDACFARLAGQIGSSNRILFKPTIRCAAITKEIAEEWLELCIKNKMLPDYIEPQLFNRGVVLDLKVLPSLLYIQLCLIRYLSEEPDIVLSCLHLVKKEGIDLYAALVMCSKVLCVNSGHNFLEGYSEYGSSRVFVKLQTSLKNVLGLRNFMSDPAKYSSENKAIVAHHFVEKAIKEVDVNLKLHWSDFKNEHIKAAIASKNAAQLKRSLEKFRKRKENEKGTGCQ